MKPPSVIFILFAANVILTCAVPEKKNYDVAITNSKRANEGYRRCMRFVNGWLANADPTTGLIPRNLNESKDFWNAQDAAADNYPFMVLTTYLLDKPMYDGVMRDMLTTERRLSSRINSLPDAYSFSKQGFVDEQPRMSQVIFGTSEYIKDGLQPLNEYIGTSPWHDRMMEMLNDLSTHITVVEQLEGLSDVQVMEVNGEMLETLSRAFWQTGDTTYLNWATLIGEYYLLDQNHRLIDREKLRLRDHGSEIIAGLSEWYAVLHFAYPDRKEKYTQPLHDLLDKVLARGRNEDGMFYNEINLATGEIINERVIDTWGYVLNAYYTIYLLDQQEPYRDATLKALRNLHKYKTYPWEPRNDGSISSADGYADAIESAINLYNREPSDSVAEWIDTEIANMWAIQRPDGIVEGWHGDGNFARTTIMYCLWKSQGTTVVPWRDDVLLGADFQSETESLLLALHAEEDWNGHLRFDRPRHREILNLPVDYPRINQFQEWFVADPSGEYSIQIDGNGPELYTGADLINGIALSIPAGKEIFITVTKSGKKSP